MAQKRTGENGEMEGEEAGCDAICLLEFCVGGFRGTIRGAATT